MKVTTYIKRRNTLYPDGTRGNVIQKGNPPENFMTSLTAPILLYCGIYRLKLDKWWKLDCLHHIWPIIQCNQLHTFDLKVNFRLNAVGEKVFIIGKIIFSVWSIFENSFKSLVNECLKHVTEIRATSFLIGITWTHQDIIVIRYEQKQ